MRTSSTRSAPSWRRACSRSCAWGESFEERRQGIELDFAVGQVNDVTRDLSDEEASKLIVAYEPVWAIGTGMVATPQSAQDAARAIRDHMQAQFGAATAQSVRILYGGSVTSHNAVQLITQPDVGRVPDRRRVPGPRGAGAYRPADRQNRAIATHTTVDARKTPHSHRVGVF